MSKNRPNETELLKASIRGNPQAFGAIVAKYQSLVCAITFSATGDIEKSEELAQQAFVNVWQNLTKLDDLTKFQAWLCATTRNVIRNFFRSQKRTAMRTQQNVENLIEAESKMADPAEQAATKEQKAVLQDALEKIPDTYREPLVLFYRQEKSVKEVARLLELTDEAARQRISRARKMLREQVAEILESTLAKTKPGKAFTTTVVAAISGLAVKTSATAAAGAALSTAGTKTGITAALSTLTAKLITTAAVVAIGITAVVTYNHLSEPNPQPQAYKVESAAQQEELQAAQTEHALETGALVAKLADDPEPNTHHQLALAEDNESDAPQQAPTVSLPDQSKEPQVSKTGVSGIIVRKSDSQPIEGAQVFYRSRENPVNSFLTDPNGHFEFLDMEPRQRQFLYVVAKDFTSRRSTVNITKDKVLEGFKIELTPGSKVAGVIYDQKDNPIKGAKVKTFHFTNHPVVTDANGSFEIDGLDPAWGDYHLHVTHPDYPAHSMNFSPPSAGEITWHDVVLKPGVTVYGRVTDSRDNPVHDVDVGNTTSRSMWNRIDTETDRDGKYELKNVDTGELVLWAVTGEYAPYVERFILDVSEPNKMINIRLADPIPLHGKIVDKQGNPVPGVNVSLREYKGVSNLTNWGDRVTSDSDGRFAIPYAPPTGEVILSVYAEHIPSTRSEIKVGRKEEYVIEVDGVGRLYGKVVDDKYGEPIKRFNVKLTFSKNGSKPGWGYSATWSREGHNFDSAQGFFDTGRENIPIGAEYSITVYADGFDTSTIDPVVVQPITEDPNRTEFRLKTATMLAGRIVDVNGTPVAGARIRILSGRNDSRHWDDRDTTVADDKGQFNLSGAGSQQRCVYVTAETFAPYIGSNLDLPRDSHGNIEITMTPGAGLFGRVIAPDGNGVPNARVSTHVLSNELRQYLDSSQPIRKQTTTDTEGYYELFDLPAGPVSVNVNSSTARGNRNIAMKTTSLIAAQGVELNFGDESGFTISGVVRAGRKMLQKANVQIRFSDEHTKWGHTDATGRFTITGIPGGTHTIHTSYYADSNVRSSRPRAEQYLSDNRQVDVQDNIELDIDFGDGSAAGTVPAQFMEREQLLVTARRWAPAKPDKDILLPRNWEYAGRAQIESDGTFTCPNLRQGRYYLLLSSKGETLGITDEFELNESEHINDIMFNIGDGTIQVNVIDADTSQGIKHAIFVVKNDLEVTFYNTKFVQEDNRSGMITDENGHVEYSPLPDGSYMIWAKAKGYLPAISKSVEISEDGLTPVIVSLERAAMVSFELDSELQKRLTAEYIYLRCRVTNTDTGDSVPRCTVYGEYTEHMVWLAPQSESIYRQSNLNLPQGQYKIEYRLYQDKKGTLSYKVAPPVLEESITVTIRKAQTQLVKISQ